MNRALMVENLVNCFCDGNKARFAQILGVRPQTINGWISRNSFDAELVYEKFGEVSAEWLLTGEGEMLKASRIEKTETNHESQPIEELVRLRAENESLKGHLADLRAILGLSGENERFSVQITTNKK